MAVLPPRNVVHSRLHSIFFYPELCLFYYPEEWSDFTYIWILPSRIVVVLPHRNVVFFRLHSIFCHPELWLFYYPEVRSYFVSIGFLLSRIMAVSPRRSVVDLLDGSVFYFRLNSNFSSHNCGCFTTSSVTLYHGEWGFLPPGVWPFTTRIVAVSHPENFAFIGFLPSNCGCFTTPVWSIFGWIAFFASHNGGCLTTRSWLFYHPDVWSIFA